MKLSYRENAETPGYERMLDWKRPGSDNKMMRLARDRTVCLFRTSARPLAAERTRSLGITDTETPLMKESAVDRTVRWLVVGTVLNAALIGLADEGKAPAPSEGEKKQVEPALGGYCPVSYLETEQAVKGDPAHKSVYIGETYYFSSAEAKNKFDASPNYFLPQFGGLCTMSLGGPYGNRLPSDPTVFAVYSGRLYLFSSERAKQLYEKSPKPLIERAYDLFHKPMAGGNCPVSYQNTKQTVKGWSAFASAYKARVYHMASAEAKELFDSDPERYVPQYRGFCTMDMAGNIRTPADPQIFRVRGNRTYLFKAESAAKAFDEKPDETIKTADANWAVLREW